jgi:hypothetical protein
MGIGILEGGAAASLSEGMDRLARGRGRKNVDQNGDAFAPEGGVDGVAVGTAMFGLVDECE